MPNNEAGKKITEICALLGEPYYIREIDHENVIYRELGHYELEVSGLDSGKANPKPVIFIWAITRGRRRVETIELPSIHTLKQALDSTTQKYLQAPPLS